MRVPLNDSRLQSLFGSIEQPLMKESEKQRAATPVSRSGSGAVVLSRLTGPLFEGSPKPEDVQQSESSACYLAAGFAAVALTHPEALQRAIRSNGDGSYTVTFQQKDYVTGEYAAVEITVDDFGFPHSPARAKTIWFALFEKAFVQWRGPRQGGVASHVIEAVLGARSESILVSPIHEETVWKELVLAVDRKWPAAAGTHGEDESALYTNTGVFADHAYTVMGHSETNGQRAVMLRNPWGGSAASLEVSLAQFCRLFAQLMFVRV